MTPYAFKLHHLAILLILVTKSAFPANPVANIQQQNANQQEQQKALQSQLDTTGKDVRSEPAPDIIKGQKYLDEPDCLKIKDVQLDKDGAVPHWLPLQRIANQAVGHCMNASNIKTIAITLQNKLIASGYITSRTELPEQNVKDGDLKIKVVSGLIGNIFLQDGSDKYVHVTNTFPTHKGKILDLRDLEQGLENMQGIPTTDVHINLLPSSEEGKSDVAIDRSQQSFWRVAGWADDSGSRSTGRYQAGLALYLDNPTSLNDLFYISASHDLQDSHTKGNKSTSLNYTVPFGYWSFNVYASENKYHQALVGDYSNYQYRGNNKVVIGKVSRVVHRGAQQKTTFSTQVIKRDAHYHIGDTEMELQRLDLTNLRFDLAHRHYLRNSVVDADLSFQRNVRWFGSKETASSKYGEASDISRIVTLDLQAQVPFELAGLAMSWQPRYYQQYSPDQLITQDQFNIGNRWTVRGFNGENTLMGDRGWYFSNTINIDMPQSWNNQLYVGVDYGRVSHINQEWVTGKSISGGTIGFRGMKWKTGYDVFAGAPISKPKGLVTDHLTLGFTLQWMY